MVVKSHSETNNVLIILEISEAMLPYEHNVGLRVRRIGVPIYCDVVVSSSIELVIAIDKCVGSMELHINFVCQIAHELHLFIFHTSLENPANGRRPEVLIVRGEQDGDGAGEGGEGGGGEHPPWHLVQRDGGQMERGENQLYYIRK